jgi:hypothetical protein
MMVYLALIFRTTKFFTTSDKFLKWHSNYATIYTFNTSDENAFVRIMFLNESISTYYV